LQDRILTAHVQTAIQIGNSAILNVKLRANDGTFYSILTASPTIKPCGP
jgi:hypothetical protein